MDDEEQSSMEVLNRSLSTFEVPQPTPADTEIDNMINQLKELKSSLIHKTTHKKSTSNQKPQHLKILTNIHKFTPILEKCEKQHSQNIQTSITNLNTISDVISNHCGGNFSSDSSSSEIWYQPLHTQSLNNVILHELYQQSRFEIADIFAKECNIEQPLPIRNKFQQMHNILQSMDRFNIEPALAWIHSKTNDSYFHLHEQLLIFLLHRDRFLHLCCLESIENQQQIIIDSDNTPAMNERIDAREYFTKYLVPFQNVFDDMKTNDEKIINYKAKQLQSIMEKLFQEVTQFMWDSSLIQEWILHYFMKIYPNVPLHQIPCQLPHSTIIAFLDALQNVNECEMKEEKNNDEEIAEILVSFSKPKENTQNQRLFNISSLNAPKNKRRKLMNNGQKQINNGYNAYLLGNRVLYQSTSKAIANIFNNNNDGNGSSFNLIFNPYLNQYSSYLKYNEKQALLKCSKNNKYKYIQNLIHSVWDLSRKTFVANYLEIEIGFLPYSGYKKCIDLSLFTLGLFEEFTPPEYDLAHFVEYREKYLTMEKKRIHSFIYHQHQQQQSEQQNVFGSGNGDRVPHQHRQQPNVAQNAQQSDIQPSTLLRSQSYSGSGGNAPSRSYRSLLRERSSSIISENISQNFASILNRHQSSGQRYRYQQYLFSEASALAGLQSRSSSVLGLNVGSGSENDNRMFSWSDYMNVHFHQILEEKSEQIDHNKKRVRYHRKDKQRRKTILDRMKGNDGIFVVTVTSDESDDDIHMNDDKDDGSEEDMNNDDGKVQVNDDYKCMIENEIKYNVNNCYEDINANDSDSYLELSSNFKKCENYRQSMLAINKEYKDFVNAYNICDQLYEILKDILPHPKPKPLMISDHNRWTVARTSWPSSARANIRRSSVVRPHSPRFSHSVSPQLQFQHHRGRFLVSTSSHSSPSPSHHSLSLSSLPQATHFPAIPHRSLLISDVIQEQTNVPLVSDQRSSSPSSASLSAPQSHSALANIAHHRRSSSSNSVELPANSSILQSTFIRNRVSSDSNSPRNFSPPLSSMRSPALVNNGIIPEDMEDNCDTIFNIDNISCLKKKKKRPILKSMKKQKIKHKRKEMIKKMITELHAISLEDRLDVCTEEKKEKEEKSEFDDNMNQLSSLTLSPLDFNQAYKHFNEYENNFIQFDIESKILGIQNISSDEENEDYIDDKYLSDDEKIEKFQKAHKVPIRYTIDGIPNRTPPGFIFHSTFVCPIAFDAMSDPQILLKCGHIISAYSARLLKKRFRSQLLRRIQDSAYDDENSALADMDPNSVLRCSLCKSQADEKDIECIFLQRIELDSRFDGIVKNEEWWKRNLNHNDNKHLLKMLPGYLRYFSAEELRNNEQDNFL